MQKYRNIFLLLIFVALFTGCAKKFELTDFKNGTVLQGEYNTMNREVKVTMPNGEVLKGHYSAVSNATFSMTNVNTYSHAYSGTIVASAYGSGMAQTIRSGGTSQAYALLKSTSSNLMMELIINYSEWNGHGFGEGRTNRGQRYKIQI